MKLNTGTGSQSPCCSARRAKSIERPSSRGGEGITADFDWVQGVDAVGLYVNVFDLTLKRLYNGAGGIEVTEYLNLKPSTPRWTREKTVLDNESFINEGLDLALKPWLQP